MAILTSIPTHLPIRQDVCDLIKLDWRMEALCADFSILPVGSAETLAVRVKITGVKQFRVVDEFVYSIEDGAPLEGNDPAGFAYIVRDGKFWQTLHEAVMYSYPSLAQYTFISLNSCLDIIATAPPTFEMVEMGGDD